MRVLVTGNTGYIGSVAMDHLATAGFEAVGLDCGYYEPCLMGTPRDRHPCLQKDLRDVEIRDLERFDAIVHLAALSNDLHGALDESITYEINQTATIRLAAMARKAGVERFVFSSSCSVYGASGEGFVDEGSPVEPLNAYGRAKAMVEAAISHLASDGFSPIILRNATAYGVSPRIRFDLMVNELAASACLNGTIPLPGDGMAWRPFVHVEDICRAIHAVLEAPKELVHDQIFNVGSTTENYRMVDLAAILRDLVPGSRTEVTPHGNGDGRSYRVDFSRIGRELPRFQPRWDVRRGVRQLLVRFREVGLRPEDLAGPRFRRVPYLRALMGAGSLDELLRWRLNRAAA